MTYEEIKKGLRQANTLASEGNLEEADRIVTGMVGKGLAPMDLSANMDAVNIRKLREYRKSR